MDGNMESDGPDSGSRTSKAVALARLLHRDCTRLLELYKEKESFPSEHYLEGDRIVSVSSSFSELSTDERVWLLHSALSQCRGLLEFVIVREAELGHDGEGEYESVRNSVRDRLGHLLHSTGTLLVKPSDPESLSQEMEGPGGDEMDSSFQAKLWTYRVLQELIHWTRSAFQTLNNLNSESEGGQSL